MSDIEKKAPPQSVDEQRTDHTARFERVDLESLEGRRLSAWIRPLLLAALFFILVGCAIFAVRNEAETLPVAGKDRPALDVLYYQSLCFLAVFLAPAVVSRWKQVPDLLGWLRKRPVLAFCSGYLIVVFFVGTLYPLFASDPYVRPLISLQPPAWGEVSEAYVSTCHGPVVDGNCHGTLDYPLGTDGSGRDVIKMVLYGLNTTLQFAVTASVLAVTAGVVVGTAAGYLGGRVDEFLMRYVDIQRSLPSFFLYILLFVLFGASYPLMILVFGLFSWGGLARQIRSEVLQRRTETFVKAARLSGARPTSVIRRHILPNTSNTVITAATVLFGKLVIYETSLSFLTLTNTEMISLGNQIAGAVGQKNADILQQASGPLFDWGKALWVVLVPAVVLCSLLLAVGLLSDRLRDELDHRP